MAEYIERESLATKLQEHRRLFLDAYGDFCYLSAKDKARVDEMSNSIAEVFNAPAADVAPVVHGVWKVGYTDKENKTTGVECSECGAFYELDLFDFGLCYNYCPNCGARMDGE